MHTIVASQTDGFGNTGTASLGFTLDTAAPVETISSTIGTDSGASPTITSGGLTKDNTLALSGTVGDTNGVSSVQVYDGANLLGTAIVSSGNWSFTTGPLAGGSHSFTAKATDNAGNVATSSAVTATIDTTAPAAGTLALANFSDTGSSGSDFISQDKTFDLSLSGAGERFERCLSGLDQRWRHLDHDVGGPEQSCGRQLPVPGAGYGHRRQHFDRQRCLGHG